MAKRFDPYDFIIRLEVQILGIEPVISRTLELPRDLNFAQLHEVLQAAIGWTDSQLHQFIVGGLVVGAPEYLEEDAYGPRVIEATDVHLRDLRFPYGPDARLEILYQYDFGDNWQHRLILSEMPPAEGVKYPRCIGGARSCPPEDVGGDIGYETFLEAWRDPDHEEHADNRRWAGRKFDPERFDLEATNRAITRALRLSRGDYRARQIWSKERLRPKSSHIHNGHRLPGRLRFPLNIMNVVISRVQLRSLICRFRTSPDLEEGQC